MKNKNKNKYKIKWKWIITVFTASFVITSVLALLSNELLGSMSIIAAFVILIFFVVVGVTFDIIALAIATADEKPFHSMAARKIGSAKYAIKIIRSADKMSSIFSDIIGDIAGIVSGSTGAAIAAALFADTNFSNYKSVIVNFTITGLIAAVTIGGKSFGKSIALNHNNDIVNIVSKIVYFFARFKINKK